MSREKRIKEFELMQSRLASELYGPLELADAVVVSPSDLKAVKSPNSSFNSNSFNSANSYSNTLAPQVSVSFEESYIIDAILNHPNTCALVFCSAKNPGGGVENGALAQEESVSLKSTWFNQVKNVKGFYLEKGASALNSNNMLYSAKSFILTSSHGDKIEPFPVSFIGSCAPNLSGMLKQGLKPKAPDIYSALSNRIEAVLKLAESKGHKHLILGAWGCGVFGLEPKEVAKCFKEKINEGWFKSAITFAIPGADVLKIFEQEFSAANTPAAIPLTAKTKTAKSSKAVKAHKP